MATEALDLPEKNTWQVVKFNQAADGVLLASFTDRDSDEVFEGVTYTSEPSMEVALAENDGMLSSDTPTKITLPAAPIAASVAFQTFLDRISSGQPYQTVEVNIAEITKGDGGTVSALKTFRGECAFLDVNSKDDKDILVFEVLTDKQKLQPIKLGMPAEQQCVNALGDVRCKLDLSPFTYNVTISDIDSKVVTVSGIPDGLVDRLFMAGFLEFETLRIRIHNWRNEVEGDKTKLFMQERPPSHWDGEVVVLKAGCDKSKETCEGTFNNLDEFNGWGYAMPDYHPVYEDGGGRQVGSV